MSGGKVLGTQVSGPFVRSTYQQGTKSSSACDDKRIVTLSPDRGSIHVLNLSLVPQKTYGLSRFLFTKTDLDSLRIALVGGEIYGVVSKASGLTMRKLKLVD
jgi:hypothetical protein